MTIAEYNRLLQSYNTQWQTVKELRAQIQAADAYLAGYGVTHRGDTISFLIKPVTRIDATRWPSVEDIDLAITTLRRIGEQTVSAFNQLTKHDQYLVKLPDRL